MDPSTPEPPGLVSSLKRLARTLLATAHNRLELFLVEVEEERRRLLEALLLAALAVLFGLMALVMLTATVVVIFWGENPLLVIGGLSAFYLLATGLAVWKLHRRVSGWAAFPATLAELKKDKACLDEPN